MTVKPSSDAMVLSVHVFSRKTTSETLPHGKAKLATDSGSVDSPIHYIFRQNCIGAHNAADTGGYENKKQTVHSCASVDKAFSPTALTLGPRHIMTGSRDHWERVARSDES